MTAGAPTYVQGVEGNSGDMVVAPGETVVASVYGRITSAAAGLNLTCRLSFVDASGNIIGSTLVGSAVAVATGAWGRASATGTAPAGTVRVIVAGRMSTSAAFAVGNTAQFTAVLVESGSTLRPFFLPDLTPGAFWDAAANASTSTLYAFAAPTVTTIIDPPTAHILWTEADLADNVGTLTLYRQFEGKTMTVRSAVDRFAAGGLATDDVELPPGVDVSFRAEIFRSDGRSLGYTPSTTVHVDGPVGAGWVSNPLDPATAPVRVEMRSTAGTGGTQEAPGAKYRVGLRTIALLAPRGLLEGVDMSFFTSTAVEYHAVRDLVDGSNGLLLFRTTPPLPVPRLLYAWTKALVWEEFNLPAGIEDFAWQNPVDELSPFEGEPISSLTPWQIYIDAFPTWGDFNAAYLTWLDAINNPPEA
ncbi:hypothetical protein IT072_03625 [Leifsonia sp. ZF2019]|uniref:hypothetical protein n=1 Tax=Leifsonia sp. ZF2019 TaxID=2781978 RepID=UPI001CBEB5DD|nr:hypothetical protein [Leifsonia sp. ZF2019]UAJ80148.1 hypothetical protein IT072_03625 [Leifsonia sp. ZF2019]